MAQTYTIKYYGKDTSNNLTWQNCAVKYYDGENWVNVVINYYTGSNWQ